MSAYLKGGAGGEPLATYKKMYRLFFSPSSLDCEQSLFFFRFSKSNARARERRNRETRETRAAAFSVSRHQSRAWPFACLAFCSTVYRKKRDCS